MADMTKENVTYMYTSDALEFFDKWSFLCWVTKISLLFRTARSWEQSVSPERKEKDPA